jgi:eukaryotic-like serine/threonine-protein kinase
MSDEHLTLLAPDLHTAPSRGASSGFPSDLLSQSAKRLRILALVYAAVFLLAGVVPQLILVDERAHFLETPLMWAPSVIGIAVALLVAAMIHFSRVSPHTAMNLGLMFEVASSYAIAAAEFGHPLQLESHRGFLGLSWVAVWVVLFTIAVPTTPRRAVVTALASVSAVPVVVGVVLAAGASLTIPPLQYFFGLVFPYLIVVGMAYVGARVVYQLGTEVKRAREMGSYVLEEKLGEGGMGEVWKARHRLLARPAAIKLIRSAGSASPAALQRFEREAQVIAQLRSAHTVQLFDYGVATDGAFYYAMELLDGVDADRLVRRFGPVPAARVIHLLRQACHSLSEAHSRGLVHRDVKPANIFVCRQGEDHDFVKVLDFGLVRMAHAAADTSSIDTREIAIHGTPAFIAPEQAMGLDVDGRADIYSLGCVAYWLLTGTTVFSSDSTMGLLVQHAQAEPDRPSARGGAPIPKALDELVMACLAKDPFARPQTARELSLRLAASYDASWTETQARQWWETSIANAAP